MDKIRSLRDGNQYSKQELGTMFSVSKSTIDRIVRPVPVKAADDPSDGANDE